MYVSLIIPKYQTMSWEWRAKEAADGFFFATVGTALAVSQ